MGSDFDPTKHAQLLLKQRKDPSSLREPARKVDALLKLKVVEKSHDLLECASEFSSLHNEVDALVRDVKSISESNMRLRETLSEPYARLKRHHLKLKLLHEVTQTLRLILKFKTLKHRLEKTLKKPDELAIAAHTLKHITEVRRMGALKGIECVEAASAWLTTCKADVAKASSTRLMEGAVFADDIGPNESFAHPCCLCWFPAPLLFNQDWRTPSNQRFPSPFSHYSISLSSPSMYLFSTRTSLGH